MTGSGRSSLVPVALRSTGTATSCPGEYPVAAMVSLEVERAAGPEREFHRVPGETGASRTKIRTGSVSFTGYPVKLGAGGASAPARRLRGAGRRSLGLRAPHQGQDHAGG